ncbi:MAG: endonuclease/exonuclease/phosphatase family protein [Woeseiaceae bacterium]|nr:endonuclease/exonuclease/phosphatase family protein [Woeseiaceae bacterium]
MATLRVVSYNVHACVGRDGRFRPDRIGDVLAQLDADIVGLQEVEDRMFLGEPVSRYLAERLDMQAYSGTTLRRGRSRYGNLLLTRSRATDLREHDLSVSGREPRGAIEARIPSQGRTLRTFVTHLGLRAIERSQQIGRLLSLFENSEDDATVLMADFNEWRPASALHRRLRQIFGRTQRPRTFPASRPVLPLDCVYAAPAAALRRVRAVRDGDTVAASDHLPVVADIDLDAVRIQR